jgi:hypothetical protein
MRAICTTLCRLPRPAALLCISPFSRKAPTPDPLLTFPHRQALGWSDGQLTRTGRAGIGCCGSGLRTPFLPPGLMVLTV